jgi:hypothetical protein
MKGYDDEQTTRSGKSNLIAKKLEKIGAAPSDKPSIALNKTSTSKSFTTKRATMIDDTVQTSASDGRGDVDLPPGSTSMTMPPSRQILAPATHEHGGEAETSRIEDE